MQFQLKLVITKSFDSKQLFEKDASIVCTRLVTNYLVFYNYQTLYSSSIFLEFKTQIFQFDWIDVKVKFKWTIKLIDFQLYDQKKPCPSFDFNGMQEKMISGDFIEIKVRM